jgi:hypothetical protein
MKSNRKTLLLVVIIAASLLLLFLINHEGKSGQFEPQEVWVFLAINAIRMIAGNVTQN